LYNSDEAQGRVLVMGRGDIPFYKKAMLAQKAGAIALIIVDTA